jgi:hypothetical protein
LGICQTAWFKAKVQDLKQELRTALFKLQSNDKLLAQR